MIPFRPGNTELPEERGCLESLRCEELSRTSRAFIRASAAGGELDIAGMSSAFGF